METINDIVCEMRKDIPRVVDTKVILRNYADRIEAARKREREAVGNAAEMRFALRGIRGIVNVFSHKFIQERVPLICDEALSSPARNCDVYRTKKERNAAYKKYREYVIMSNDNPFFAQDEMMSKEEWLFAEVKGETK